MDTQLQPGTIRMTPVRKRLEARLYLFQAAAGEGKNQTVVVDLNNHFSFGTIAVNDWLVYDSLGPNKRVVAHAQGTQVHVLNSPGERWKTDIFFVFENDGLKGSTLEVRGSSVTEVGEWAIVGGTGEFARAEGIMYKKVVQDFGNNRRMVELNIDATYGPSSKWT
ncbi:Dirigent protein [Rhynchospora pubera]|uniref:Dirigent protein n=1 Tax=Rhynchospora pubera TaxID=906938 RepID=A0AAV8DMN9_9POAL|nr:Dirigent protein [Rhynchospora pubera]